MGLWSYSQLTSLHLAFIKLRLSQFVALVSHRYLLPKANSLTKSSDAQDTASAAARQSKSAPNACINKSASQNRNRRADGIDKKPSTCSRITPIATAAPMPQLARDKTFALFPRCWSTMQVDGSQSAATKNMSRSAIGITLTKRTVC
jgi:hypothetical protein